MDDPSSRSDSSGHGQVLRFRKVVGVRGAGDAGTELSASDLFTILWLGLADILGTAAAATLLRRASQRVVLDCPELAELSITRARLEYHCVVPSTWNDSTATMPRALCELTRELWTLLVELTGTVVVNRLAQIPELKDRGIIPERVSKP